MGKRQVNATEEPQMKNIKMRNEGDRIFDRMGSADWRHASADEVLESIDAQLADFDDDDDARTLSEEKVTGAEERLKEPPVNENHCGENR
jgi:hypothetical protein